MVVQILFVALRVCYFPVLSVLLHLPFAEIVGEVGHCQQVSNIFILIVCPLAVHYFFMLCHLFFSFSNVRVQSVIHGCLCLYPCCFIRGSGATFFRNRLQGYSWVRSSMCFWHREWNCFLQSCVKTCSESCPKACSSVCLFVFLVLSRYYIALANVSFVAWNIKQIRSSIVVIASHP